MKRSIKEDIQKGFNLDSIAKGYPAYFEYTGYLADKLDIGVGKKYPENKPFDINMITAGSDGIIPIGYEINCNPYTWHLEPDAITQIIDTVKSLGGKLKNKKIMDKNGRYKMQFIFDPDELKEKVHEYYKWLSEDFDLTVKATPEKVDVKAKGDEAEEMEDFARSIFGDNFDFFNAFNEDEEDVDEEEDAEEVDAEAEEDVDEVEEEEDLDEGFWKDLFTNKPEPEADPSRGSWAVRCKTNGRFIEPMGTVRGTYSTATKYPSREAAIKAEFGTEDRMPDSFEVVDFSTESCKGRNCREAIEYDDADWSELWDEEDWDDTDWEDPEELAGLIKKSKTERKEKLRKALDDATNIWMKNDKKTESCNGKDCGKELDECGLTEGSSAESVLTSLTNNWKQDESLEECDMTDKELAERLEAAKAKKKEYNQDRYLQKKTGTWDSRTKKQSVGSGSGKVKIGTKYLVKEPLFYCKASELSDDEKQKMINDGFEISGKEVKVKPNTILRISSADDKVGYSARLYIDNKPSKNTYEFDDLTDCEKL